ncbi:hypothetical protein MLD38_011824 [Melastoma candidum]|uniref:Uncharacterized protein n=1 Tax=Melastoma candidum TaxID=119954 RepID=A0ACB9R4A4_9MYRT|nr:hypothetical protein MLD38_011824 [Melastoma candidum]
MESLLHPSVSPKLLPSRSSSDRRPSAAALPPCTRPFRSCLLRSTRASGSADHSGNKKAASVPNSNYVVPLDKSSSSYSSFITRPLVEILRDLNKRIPDGVLVPRPDHDHASPPYSLPWYHANRMLSFYAPGWCGEVRDVIYSDTGSVTVLYRVTVRGSDGEAHREASGTVSADHGNELGDRVAAAEEIAFCRACARFGLGLYLYHED